MYIFENETPSWQELEELTRKILELHDFEVEFRKVFRNSERKFEIDVVATKAGLCLAIDCKRYGHSRYRRSPLRSEAGKHKARCREFERIFGRKAIPIIVSFIDDDLLVENGCIFVPIDKLNDFLLNLGQYLESFDDKIQNNNFSSGTV